MSLPPGSLQPLLAELGLIEHLLYRPGAEPPVGMISCFEAKFLR